MSISEKNSIVQFIAPYKCVATFYDQLMAHVDYQEWADYLLACFKLFGRQIRRVLDGGCGTGSLMAKLNMGGFSVAGFDLSYDMVVMAKQKGLEFVWQGNLLQPSVRELWDCMVSLYDTVHYLTKAEIPVFFQAVQKIIRPEGLLIIDLVTEHHVKNYWADYTENGEESGFRYCRRSWYEPEEKCQHTLFEIGHRANTLYKEHHYQWIHPAPFVIAHACSSGFSLAGQFDECTFHEAASSSDRIHLIFIRRS
jgi:SAM-dependent methyltransferase